MIIFLHLSLKKHGEIKNKNINKKFYCFGLCFEIVFVLFPPFFKIKYASHLINETDLKIYTLKIVDVVK